MTDNDRPRLWLLDSERTPLAGSQGAFCAWADATYYAPPDTPDWDDPPDAVFFSAEIPGGASGDAFLELAGHAAGIPLLAVAGIRSLAQAVGYFRAGVADYLALPLEEEHARARFEAAIRRAAQLALHNVVVGLERLDGDTGDIELSLHAAEEPDAPQDEIDILAELSGDGATEPFPAPDTDAAGGEEPEAVDGLPIPTMWEELPCGLLVFDSGGNLVFANALGLDGFGCVTLAELQDVLENRRHTLAAHGINNKPLADNQWPHLLAVKTRTARSAVISIRKPDNRRAWLRIDCLPHLSEGTVNRLSMTLVNLTGDLPPLAVNVPVRSAGGKGKNRKR